MGAYWLRFNLHLVLAPAFSTARLTPSTPVDNNCYKSAGPELSIAIPRRLQIPTNYTSIKEALWIIPLSNHFKEPTDKKTRAGYGKFLRPNTPYDNFMESQGIPIYRDIGVRRVQDLPRKPWKRMGGNGTFIQLLGTEGLWGCYVVEVPGAGAFNPEKHLYEEQYLSRRGTRHHRSLGRRQSEEAHV